MLRAGSWRGSAAGGEASAAEDEAEAALVARAKAERLAFEPLYRRYLDPVYRYCHGCLGTREAAEDATSLTFARALAALPSCRDGSFRSWLFAIAHNVVVDARRRSRPVVALDDIELVETGASGAPEAAALAAEGERGVRALLAQLPDQQRHVVQLRLAGLTGPEIARALGRSHASVRVIQFRAYGRLREMVGERDRQSEGGRG